MGKSEILHLYPSISETFEIHVDAGFAARVLGTLAFRVKGIVMSW